MKKVFYALIPFLISACSDVNMEDLEGDNSSNESSQSIQNVQLGIEQAKAYAKLFATGFENNDAPQEDGLSTRSSNQTTTDRTIHDVNFLVDSRDTLLYAVNYKNNQGFVILSGANNSFPIVAHSSTGNIDLHNISSDNPLTLIINSCKQKAKKALADSTAIHSAYYDEWKDLGKKGYDYEVELSSDEPDSVITRGRRRDSSGKASIYPYTGKDLDCWCQEEGYNYYTPLHYSKINKRSEHCLIGCPAIAIGMLMYDTSQRMLGNSMSTYPYFSYYDKYDIKKTSGAETAQKLRQIADSIPHYQWGLEEENGSGANASEILTGLHRLGYKKAQSVSYNFETLYKNLSFKGRDYFGNETTYNRGVLIAAGNPYRGGHIWFCDGYYEQSYNVKKKFLGITVSSWKEYDDRIYMNWGWGSNRGNGWYCATENFWSSLDNEQQYYNQGIIMFVNLNYYENPQYNR